MLLAGDVGGTNMRLALFEEEDGRLVEKRRARFATGDFRTLHDALEGFLAGEKRLEAAAFGVAGPVRHGRAEGTNVTFSIDAEEIRADLGVPAVVLNDLEANAWGLAELGPGDFAVLNRGEEDPTGNGALISAGTGLGEALLFRSAGGFVPMPSEGGTPPSRRGTTRRSSSSRPSVSATGTSRGSASFRGRGSRRSTGSSASSREFPSPSGSSETSPPPATPHPSSAGPRSTRPTPSASGRCTASSRSTAARRETSR